MNRNILPLILAGVLSSAFADEKKKPESPDAPPGGVIVTQSAPAAGGRARRSSAPSSTVRRSNEKGEIKSFSFSSRARAFLFDRRTRPLIVRSGPLEAKAASQLQEDLAIMGRILEKSIAEFKDEHEEAAGIPILTLGSGKGVRSLYLEDYGVIFTLNVNIPLRGEPAAETAEQKTQLTTNEDWNEARNELFGDRRATAEKTARRDFDPTQVEELQATLLEALVNGSNIRNLRENDWLTIVLRGRGDIEVEERFDVIVRNSGKIPLQGVTPPGEDDERALDPSTMVLRIKKADLDELARKKANSEQLKQKVTINLY